MRQYDERYVVVLIAILSALMLLLLVGCGEGEPAVSVLPSPTAEVEPSSPLPSPTPSPEPSPMIVTLELWLPESLDPYSEKPEAEVLARQLSEFRSAYPELQVVVVVKKERGRGGLLDFMRTAQDAAPGVLPDLVVLDTADLEALTKSDLLQPLDDHIASSAAEQRFSFANAMGEVEGQTMGVVLGVDVQHMAYRRDLFASPPVSWTTVVSAPTTFLFPAGGYERIVNDATLIQYLAAGGTLADEEGEPALNEEPLVQVFDFYSRCVTNTVIAPTDVLTLTHVDQAWEKFKAGEGGMSAVRASRYWTEADETMAPASLPTSDGESFTIARGWALAMVTDDPVRQELAMQLFDWLTDPEQNASWTETAGYLPVTRRSLRRWAISDEEYNVLRNLLEGASPPLAPDVVESIGPPMQESLENLLNGESSPQEAASEAVDRVEEGE